MKVKVTKTLTKELAKRCKHPIACIKLGERAYKWNVDIDIWKHDIDYNWQENNYNVIVVEYPDNYYACNKYITTLDLQEIYKQTKTPKTLDNFCQAFNEYIAI